MSDWQWYISVEMERSLQIVHSKVSYCLLNLAEIAGNGIMKWKHGLGKQMQSDRSAMDGAAAVAACPVLAYFGPSGDCFVENDTRI
ncbi:hypothetical protein GUJ93_ZPchr0010g7810 [Zizania palustris]|uniref:Uncharacterized protein n=1 Tax=Zizania palustris TaxID=103762 RepID=A0A8J6BM53_ZIZPA|nr:hypothetical protein GUJ93_ZPchr0010g7810 [Zizania palustris]